jgi:hypothetical protein
VEYNVEDNVDDNVEYYIKNNFEDTVEYNTYRE